MTNSNENQHRLKQNRSDKNNEAENIASKDHIDECKYFSNFLIGIIST